MPMYDVRNPLDCGDVFSYSKSRIGPKKSPVNASRRGLLFCLEIIQAHDVCVLILMEFCPPAPGCVASCTNLKSKSLSIPISCFPSHIPEILPRTSPGVAMLLVCSSTQVCCPSI